MSEKYNQQNQKSFTQEISDTENEGKKSLKRKQKERVIRKKRKKIKNTKKLLRFLFVVGIILLIYYVFTLSGWYLNKDAFTNPKSNSVEIVNNKLTKENLIYKSLENIKIKKIPIFMVSITPMKKAILKIPVIKSVYIRRYGFPARLLIIVRERTPIAVLKTDLSKLPIAFVTTDGMMIKDAVYMQKAQNNDTLIILVKNQKLDKDWDVKRIEFIEKIAKSVEAYSGEKVEYIDMKNPNDVFVKIETTNIRLGVLDSTVFERIKRIYTILPQIDEVEGTIKYIDLSWDKVNYLKMQNKNEQNVKQSEKNQKKDEL